MPHARLLLLLALSACGIELPCVESVVITTDELPADVQASIDSEYPGSEVLEAEQLDGDGDTYRVELETSDGDTLLVEVDAWGEVQSVEFDVERNNRCDDED